ncbi:MAG TPA: hypothetical protein PLY87_23780 [Planctomycetaceae bacterium]|nr:hypothetical protein [Planctomycetaceae bacterium]HQZ68140.1 hypothetical protein [Planctomycetaceae bacterium]
MHNSSSMPRQFLEPEQLHDLLRHVDAEEISLRNTLRLLQAIPSSAQSSVDAEQRTLRTQIEQSMQHAAFLAKNRMRVLTNLAQHLSMRPQEVSFSALLPYASPAAVQLLIPARRRLLSLVCQVSALAQSVSWVIHETQRISLSLFDTLPGAANSDRYNGNGQKQLNPALFRFETRS